MITLVCPVVKKDLSRFELSLSSLEKKFDLSIIKEYIIIIRKKEYKKIENSLVSKIPIRVVYEESLINPKLIKLFPKKWYLQQALKIAVSKIITTKMYLVLDCDTILIKRLNNKKLFPNDLPIFNLGSKKNHKRWWEGSLKTLKYRKKKSQISINGEEMGIGVTPCIVYTKIMLELIDYLEKIKGELGNWVEYLLSINTPRWTEYTMYYLYIEENYKVKDLYDLKTKYILANFENSLWRIAKLNKFISNVPNLQKQYGYFIVIQGTTRISTEKIKKILNRKIIIIKSK